MTRKTVAIIYKYVPNYRLPFFQELFKIADVQGIDVKIVYGDPGRIDRLKNDAAVFEHGVYCPNKFIRLFNHELILAPVFNLVRDADLVVVEQANKLLINYLLLGRQLLHRQKMAFWGHGKNFQAQSDDRFSEWLKTQMVRWPHWWFAYTDGTAKIVRDRGFPTGRITVLNNAIDTTALREARAAVTADEIAALRAEKGLISPHIGIFAGSMYPEKRLDFLLDACERIRARITDFQMVFIGAGPDDHLVKAFCERHSWCIHVGPAYGKVKAAYFALSKVFLMPGLVGLAVLDAMVLETPIVTTDLQFHSPEIDYLENGRNGIITAPHYDLERYVEAVCEILENEQRRQALVAAGLEVSSVYTIENMAKHFLAGAEAALSADWR